MISSPEQPSIAAEFVLGLLDASESEEAEHRLASLPGFANEVAFWRARFAELNDTADELPPTDGLWERIEYATLEATSPSGRRSVVLELIARFWNNLTALRFAAVGGTVAAVALAVFALVALQRGFEVEARKPVYVAILIDDASRQTGAIVNAFADGRVEMIPLIDMNVPRGRALQVWTLWNRETGPRSVALLSRARAIRLDLANMPTTSLDQLFEITLEREGGSPTGRPTGPILYKGTMARAL